MAWLESATMISYHGFFPGACLLKAFWELASGLCCLNRIQILKSGKCIPWDLPGFLPGRLSSHCLLILADVYSSGHPPVGTCCRIVYALSWILTDWLSCLFCSSPLCFSFQKFFLHGESTVCVSVDIERKAPLYRLTAQQLKQARSSTTPTGKYTGTPGYPPWGKSSVDYSNNCWCGFPLYYLNHWMFIPVWTAMNTSLVLGCIHNIHKMEIVLTLNLHHNIPGLGNVLCF